MASELTYDSVTETRYDGGYVGVCIDGRLQILSGPPAGAELARATNVRGVASVEMANEMVPIDVMVCWLADSAKRLKQETTNETV